MYYGSIEAGGTKFVCAIGNEELEILERVSFPTTTPEETMSAVIDYFKKYQAELEPVVDTCFYRPWHYICVIRFNIAT